jgi:pimeloyl-ACP methyl ester carboxylesterase
VARRLRRVLALLILGGVGAAAVWAIVAYRRWTAVPRERLAPGGHHEEMPPDAHHRYLELPLDHEHPERGRFVAFYILDPAYDPAKPVVFFLADGQQELVDTRPDHAFFRALLGDVSTVLIGPRGQAPTLLPEVYRPDGSLDAGAALRLYGSRQAVEDIEAVRLDLERQGRLPAGGRIAVFGASGGAILAQQYLARHGAHVERALLESTGAPDLARRAGKRFARDLGETLPEAVGLLDGITPELGFVLFRLGQLHAPEEARRRQLAVARAFAAGDVFPYGALSLDPRYRYDLVSFLIRSPRAAAIRVRMVELLGPDLDRGGHGLDPLAAWSRPLLEDLLAEARRLPPLDIARAGYAGEVLILAGVHDQVFGVDIARRVAAAYPRARLACFDDGHRLSRAPDELRAVREGFFRDGLGSDRLARHACP